MCSACGAIGSNRWPGVDAALHDSISKTIYECVTSTRKMPFHWGIFLKEDIIIGKTQLVRA